MTKCLLKEVYIMCYDQKNVRNEKNVSKKANLLNLRPLTLKSKFIRQFQFSENSNISLKNVTGRQGLSL